MEFNAYYFIIGLSLVIILSYLFNIIAKKTSIPSVLMLITLGVIINPLFSYFGINILNNVNLMPALEVLGTVGLIKIVLEAALDLKLKKEKIGLILKSLFVAAFGLFATTAAITTIFITSLSMEFNSAVLFAIPLSVISSAIVIPSVTNLIEAKKEFLIYESAFSDILGIMLFYFYLDGLKLETTTDIIIHISKNVTLTIIIAIVVGYGLIWVFQKIEAHVKFFLLFSFLLLLYSVGKLYHLSPLLIILFFGLIINNHRSFFMGFMKNWIDEVIVDDVLNELKLMTAELAFLIRTFFFVIFGLSIVLSSLFNVSVIATSCVILIILYLIRAISFIPIDGKDITPQTYISPRGLITILLFFAIPEEYKPKNVDENIMNGIILFVIIATGVVMTIALIKDAKNKKKIIQDDIISANLNENSKLNNDQEL